MVILGRWKQSSLTISEKTSSITISLQDKDGSQVFSYDALGRLWTAMLKDVSYRRGLNGRTVAKWQTPESSPASIARARRWLAPGEAAQLEEQARQTAGDLLSALSTGQAVLSADLPAAARAMLERAAQFDSIRCQADVQAYHQVYSPVGILPPDQYMAVVLQATEGCSFNTCTFCTFYRDRRFRIKTVEEFRSHARAVKQYLGDGLLLRRTIFLGDANALVIPMPRLLPMLDTVHEEFDVERMGGIFAFLDGFSGEKKAAQDYSRLAEKGLKRIYIGMESGSDELLGFLKKPGKIADVIQAVSAIKAGGISVGVIVLLGAGGRFYAPLHVRQTIQALNSMRLDMDDLVYFSELIESEGMQYTADAYKQNLQPLSPLERIAQGDEIEAGLSFSPEGGEPHISRYDIREFVY
jgi:hypothetical protein